MSNKKESKNQLKDINKTGYHLAQRLYEKFSSEFKSSDDLVKKFGWKMLNYISSNNKERFIEYLYRIYWSYGIEITKGVFEILNTNNFQKYALAFMNGFISGKNNNEDKFNNKEANNE